MADEIPRVVFDCNVFLQCIAPEDRGQAILIKNVPEEFHYQRDPKDEAYVNLAIVTDATFLVSKDDDLLDLMTSNAEESRRFRSRYPFLRILNAADFIRTVER